MVSKNLTSAGLGPAAFLLLLAGLVVGWLSSTTMALQGTVREPVSKITSGRVEISGNLHVRLSAPGPGDPVPEKYFEKVERVVLQEDWAILSLFEDDEPVTLAFPRESLVYVKTWQIKDEEKD